MSYRFTNTDKWSDAWFLELKPIEKLLFMYLCDNCDIAGFIEYTPKKWAYDIGSEKGIIEGACKGLVRGLINSENNDCVFIKNFLKHQKIYPFNEKNTLYNKGIISRFNANANKFNVKTIEELIEGAYKGLVSPLGIGNGNIVDNKDKIKTWKTDFETYKIECLDFYNRALKSKEWIAERQKYHPALNIQLSLEKAVKDYWLTEKAWKGKKVLRIESINWKTTFNNALSQKSNQVWLQKDQIKQTNEPERVFNIGK